MKTYPIYEARFGGSSDYMAHAIVSVAAVNMSQAIKRFEEWDKGQRGNQGWAGSFIIRSQKLDQWCRPEKIESKYIVKNTKLRAVSKDWWNFKKA